MTREVGVSNRRPVAPQFGRPRFADRVRGGRPVYCPVRGPSLGRGGDGLPAHSGVTT